MGVPGGMRVVAKCDDAHEVIEALEECPLACFARGALQASLHDVFVELGSSWNLSVLRANYEWPSPVNSAEVVTWASNVLKMDELAALGDAVTTASKAYGHPEGSDPEWRCRDLLTLVRCMCEHVPDDGFSMSLHSLCVATGSPPSCTSKSSFLALCSTLSNLSEVVCTLAMVCSRASAESGAEALRDHHLRLDMERAMKFLSQKPAMVAGMLRDLMRQNPFMAKWPLTVSLQDCLRWTESVGKAAPMVLRFCVGLAVNGLGDLGNELLALTPRYDHVVSDSSFSPALAKKQVLMCEGRKSLNGKTIALFKALSECSRIHTSLALGVPLREDQEWKETVDAANAIYEEARRAIAVVAGLNVLFELKGKEKGEQVATVL